MPSPSFLSWGSTPHRTDTINTLLKRIAGGLADGTTGGGGTPNEFTAQVWSGVGDPVHTPTVANQVYTDTSTGTIWNWYLSAWH